MSLTKKVLLKESIARAKRRFSQSEEEKSSKDDDRTFQILVVPDEPSTSSRQSSAVNSVAKVCKRDYDVFDENASVENAMNGTKKRRRLRWSVACDDRQERPAPPTRTRSGLKEKPARRWTKVGDEWRPVGSVGKKIPGGLKDRLLKRMEKMERLAKRREESDARVPCNGGDAEIKSSSSIVEDSLVPWSV